MKQEITNIKKAFLAAVRNVSSAAELEKIRIEYLGRKTGKLNVVLRSLKSLAADEKRVWGPLANKVRQELEMVLAEAKQQFVSGEGSVSRGASTPPLDLSLPGIKPAQGHLHPLTIFTTELLGIFRAMGFTILEGPEVENDFYNFTALNIPQSHPARDIQDTFFLKTPITRVEKRRNAQTEWVMRTHTSNMQVRYMEEHKPPLRCVVAGRCFRNEATDASHDFTFYQLEGFVVDKNITIGNLMWTIREIFRQMFKSEVQVRFRPGYFPFTEPSYEPDVSCPFCQQKAAHCKVCKGTGWIEMAGAGMIHPHVFKAAGYPAGKYTGFAFGGFYRMAMLKYGIDDIRAFMSNDLRFLEQF